MKQLTHFDSEGKAKMVNVGLKPPTQREAIACGTIRMKEETLELLKKGKVAKGDAFGVAKIAGILAAKKTSDLTPLCNPLPLEHIDLFFRINDQRNLIEIQSIVRTQAKTGVEMEALTAVSIAALTLYDMLKASDKGIMIENIHLVKKSGGKSGTFVFGKDGKTR